MAAKAVERDGYTIYLCTRGWKREETTALFSLLSVTVTKAFVAGGLQSYTCLLQ